MDFKFFAKALFMVGSLGLVIYGIQTLKSPKFAEQAQKEDSALNLLLGTEARPMNWCMMNPVKVEIYSGEKLVKTLTENKDISAVCEILIGSLTKEAADKAPYAKRLVATDAKGTEKVLEQAYGTGYFRVQGMPFSSPMLEKALGRLTQP